MIHRIRFSVAYSALIATTSVSALSFAAEADKRVTFVQPETQRARTLYIKGASASGTDGRSLPPEIDRAFFVSPAAAVVTMTAGEQPIRSARRFDYNTLSGGWAGYYDNLGDVDVTSYNVVAFRVKGQKGGETFDIGFADLTMPDPELDATYVGSVQLYLAGGVSTEWQDVIVPLCAVRTESRGSFFTKNFAGVVLLARNQEKSTVFVDEVQFRTDTQVEHDYLCTGVSAGARTTLVQASLKPESALMRHKRVRWPHRTGTRARH